MITQSATAKVVVLANRSVESITVELNRLGEVPQSLRIPSGESLPVFFQRRLNVVFGTQHHRDQFTLQPYTAYYFASSPDGNFLRLEQIGLGETTPPASPEELLKVEPLIPSFATIDVKLMVDENEPTHRRIWEPKLRNRIAEASRILEQQAGIRLRVVEVGTWDSDEKQKSFARTLSEFEREVKPNPAKLCIGFSSQYQATRGRSHLGVTRWPMHSHILLRERSRDLMEVEKLELLVHELGHYLGASHSPEPQSVMRPLLTRGLQRAVGSRITFDPVNALIIAIMGEEIRKNGVSDIRKISQPTRNRLKEIYEVLVLATPRDPAARQYVRILSLPSAPARVAVRPATQRATPLGRDTKTILKGLTSQAEKIASSDKEISSDELTNQYVRQAARSAAQLRSANARRAMLLALGIFVDDSTSLRNLPATGKFAKQVETDEARTKRLEVMGKPTMRERADLVKHFFVSAHLYVALGKKAAIAAGLAKEMSDSAGGTGFSFVDMAANRAGIVFAEHVLDERVSLAELAEEFHVDDFLPTLRGLEEGIQSAQLEAEYQSDGKPTIQELLEDIESRVLSLPVYDQL